MRTFYGVIIVLLITTLVVGAIGELLSRSNRHPIGTAPTDLNAQTVTLPILPNDVVAGWFISGKPGKGAILLIHGIRGNRLSMLERAKFLHKAGYSTLLIDLPAHGESSGHRITFGKRESEAVKVALNYLHQQLPHEKIAVIGVSLGAAALVLAAPLPPLNAVVLESMFPTIKEAVVNRLQHHLGRYGGYLSPLLLWQLPLWSDVSAQQLQPITKISNLHAPLLIASGGEDKYTTRHETTQIFQAANAPKTLWLVEGATHQDLQAFAPKDYENRILTFFATYLHSP